MLQASRAKTLLCCCMGQYEDPTDGVQAMRERIELRRAAQLPWLTELAATTARSAAAAANGSAQVRQYPCSPC